MTVTDFSGCYGNGDAANVDAFGNNVAFLCNKCGHPVLAVVRKDQRGNSIKNPAVCRECGEEFVIEGRETTEKIVIYNASEL